MLLLQLIGLKWKEVVFIASARIRKEQNAYAYDIHYLSCTRCIVTKYATGRLIPYGTHRTELKEALTRKGAAVEDHKKKQRQ